ncbi:MAG: PKD domain-containing protein, partial [Planctomycetes bacterium]|nr:PKD domain-containing protein [Planctomycetota bacterium]
MTKNGFAVWAALVFALALNLQGAWPGEPESQLTKGVGGGMHEDKDAATKFSNPVPVDGRAHNYGADVVSKQVMERASVAPVDPEMFWNHPMSHSDVTRAPFKGTITPQEIKDDGYFSKFWGKMKSGAGGAGPGGAGDQTWDFFGKMETFGIASAQARVFNKELAHVKAKENVKFQAKVTMTSSGHEGKLIYHWDFGDGTTSQDKNPTHQYYEGGVKNVTLTV